MFTNKLHEKADQELKQGNVELAIELYSKALEENPNDYNIISDRGVAFLNKNDKENCFADLNLAIELQPNYGYRYACRAFAKNNFGDLDGAIEDYEIAVELDPDDAVAINNLGLLLEQKGYKFEAEEKFKRADILSKMEDNLLDVMNELESDNNNDKIEHKPEVRPELIPNREQSLKTEFKKVFTSSSQFKEFLAFIKNGFRIK